MGNNNLKYISFYSILILFPIVTVAIQNCKKEETPSVSTGEVTSISYISATCESNVTNRGSSDIIRRGVCWSIYDSPTTDDNCTNDSAGIGKFFSNIIGLTAGTKYYVRAYAINNTGTSYGEKLSFTTLPMEVPSVTTSPVTLITMTSATGGGNVRNEGGTTITYRGLCWSTSSGPTVSDSKTSDEKGLGEFSGKISGLQGGTTYYVRAYATNSVGTGYGTDISFTTATVPFVPTVTTLEVSNIESTTVTGNGIVSSDGDAPVTARGISLSTSMDPVLSPGKKISAGSDTGTFSCLITRLTPGTIYYVRAYAYNTAGYGYGSYVSLTTKAGKLPIVTTAPVSQISTTTAISGGKVTDNGESSVTSRGICWSTSADPAISDSKTTDGSGVGTFTSNLEGLTRGTAYHLRAYATNTAGTAYGSDIQFSTSAVPEVPTVVLSRFEDIYATRATVFGEVLNNGETTFSDKGFCWSQSSNPTLNDSHQPELGNRLGKFSTIVKNLVPETTYHIRTYATNTIGTGYSSDSSFTTKALVIPLVLTNTVSSITSISAQCSGSVIDNRGIPIVSSGICWSTHENPIIYTDNTGSGSTVYMKGLAGSTIYYIRAFAINSDGAVGYGNQVSFTTLPAIVPSVSAKSVTNVTTTSATFGGKINNDGGAPPIIAAGICYGTSPDPTILDNVVSCSTVTTDFSLNLTGLYPGTVYYVKAFATNSVGIGYSESKIVKTFDVVPIYGSISDIEGNTYRTVVIGSQTWMADNLRTTATILTTDPYDLDLPWLCIDHNSVDPVEIPCIYYYQWAYGGDESNLTNYGRLYTWYAAKMACPTGWHLPSDAEWSALFNYLGANAPDKMKIAGTNFWPPPNTNATNESGFSALPGGKRTNNSFINKGTTGYWWSSSYTTDHLSVPWTWAYGSYWIMSNSISHNYGLNEGLSVRCIKN